MGQSVHISDPTGRIIYWNRTAENLYGYSANEALGQDSTELLTDAKDFDVASNMIRRISMGESWTGKFPVKNKIGERFVAVTTNTPFYDDDGSLIGIICVSSDSRPFLEMQFPVFGSKVSESSRSGSMNKVGNNSEQPLQVAIASKISNLASKVTNRVRSKIRTGENNVQREGGSGDSQYSYHTYSDVVVSDNREDANSSGASTPRGDVTPTLFGQVSRAVPEEKSPGKSSRDSGDEGEGKTGIHKIITSKAEAWMEKKGMTWPWKANERESSETKATRFGWPWVNNDQENDSGQQKSNGVSMKSDSQAREANRHGNNEASGSWSSSMNVNSTSSVSSNESTTSSRVNKVDSETDYLDYEILWEDLTIGEQIGQGSCGTVYHGLWYGSDVAVKVFSKQEYSDDVILTFRKEYLVDAGLYETNEETSKREEVLCQIDQVDAKRVVTFGILSLSDPRSHIIFHLFYVVGDKVAHSPIGDWILLLVHNTAVAIWWASHHIPSLVTQNLNTHMYPGIYTDLVRTLLSVNAIEDRFCCHYNHKKLVQPTETEGWAIVNFSVRGDIKKIWTDLARCGQQNGIYIEDPCAVFGEDAQARQAPPLVRVEQMLEKIKSKLTHLPRFLLCLLSEKKTSTIHVPWKRMTIADLGIVTHCISPLRVNDQYLTNVILEMNAKVGGLNSMLAMEQSPCIPFIVADFSRMEVLPPSPPLPLNSKHHAKLKLVPRARPGFARRGQPITLLANHFKVTVGSVDDDFYQYSVALSSDDGSPVDGKGIGRKVIDKLQETYDTELAGKDFAYDGEDILFTVGGPLPHNKLQFTVILEDLS